jgi:hypothetical protein
VVRLALIAHMPETWEPLPDPILEEEVKIWLNWTADRRTTRAIKRQAKLMGMTANQYLTQVLAAAISDNEAFTVVGSDGQLMALS